MAGKNACMRQNLEKQPIHPTKHPQTVFHDRICSVLVELQELPRDSCYANGFACPLLCSDSFIFFRRLHGYLNLRNIESWAIDQQVKQNGWFKRLCDELHARLVRDSLFATAYPFCLQLHWLLPWRNPCFVCVNTAANTEG